MAPDHLPDPLAVALEVAGILERLGIPYLAAGSLASSVHGEPRSTNDVDLVVDLAGHVAGLLRALGDRYYVSADAVGEATRTGGTFNLIHLATAVKVDVFVSRDDPFDAERLARRTQVRIGPDEGDVLKVDTAEHTILRKLEWYRRGDEVSERQWRDVLGVLRAQPTGLDWDRLAAWAARLGVADLLARARRESRGP
jgi:hypothetical protein